MKTKNMLTTIRCFFYTMIMLLVTTTILAQGNLESDAAFFQKAGKNYQHFLEDTKFSEVLRLDTVQIFPDKVILELVMTKYRNWASLSAQYAKDFEVDIRKTLYDKATFLFEIEDDSLGIRIWSPDFALCEVQLYSYENEFKVIENYNKSVRLDSLVLEKKRLPKIAKMNTYNTIATCKTKIEKALKKHYRQKSSAVKIDANTSRPKELKLKIWNIRGEVLHDAWLFPYWEYLTIVISFKEKNGQLFIYYKVQAKYGSGIFRGPRLSDYTDMDRHYKEYVDNYMDKLNEIIYNAIK